MTIYYVRTDGNDANTGTINSSSGAWATIQKAANTVQPGDSVRVQEGTYIENNIQFKKSGNSANWITYTCDGACIIKGTTKNPGNYGLLLLGISYVKFENFTVSTYFVGIRGDSYLGANINNVTLYNIKVTDVSYDGIGFGAYTTNLIIDSVDVGFFGDHGIGIYALNSGELNRYITIKNSKVHDNTGESGQYHNAIDIHTNIWDVTLQNNEIWNIFGSQSAFYVHNWNVKRVTIKDNYIHESDRGMQLIGVSDSLIENNTIENTDTYSIAMYQDSLGAEPNNNIIFRNNIMKGTKRWEGCVRIQRFYDNYNTNILFDNNSITGCSNGQSYSLASDNNVNLIIRDQIEKNFIVNIMEDPPVNSFVEFTNGRIFKVNTGDIPYWSNTRSFIQLATLSNIAFTGYNSTLNSTGGSVTVSNFSTSGMTLNMYNLNVSRIDFTLADSVSGFNIILINCPIGLNLYLYNNSGTLIDTKISTGTVLFNDLLVDGIYYITNGVECQQPICIINITEI